MNYAFSFDTLSAYQAAKGSGGAIYSALATSTYVSRAATSFIKELGRTVVDSVNTIVARDKGGEVGDCLLYKGGTYYWLKGSQSWNASAIGSCTHNTTDLTNAGYTRVGFVVDRRGNRCLLMSCADVSGTHAWSSDTSTVVPGVSTFGSIRRNRKVNLTDGTRSPASYNDNWIAPISCWWAEYRYPSNNAEWGDYAYVLPFQRSVWNTVVDKVKTNTAGSGSFTQGTWSVAFDNNKKRYVGKIVTNVSAVGSMTIDVEEFDYDFEKWYRECMIPQIPSVTNASSDMKGRNNTLVLKAFNDAPAAIQCLNYAVSGVPEFGAGSWWLASMGEWMLALNNAKTWIEKGCPITISWYWTSTQSSASYAWLVATNRALVNHTAETNSRYVRPFAAFQI